MFTQTVFRPAYRFGLASNNTNVMDLVTSGPVLPPVTTVVLLVVKSIEM